MVEERKHTLQMPLPDILQNISEAVQRKGGRAVVVGGSVRDLFLELPIKDYDIEVYGLADLEALEALLQPFGSVNLVGRSFGVLKLKAEGVEYDFSFPRTEQKIGKGHRDFTVTVDGSLHFEKAAKRRDFTINALGYDIETGEVLDPYGGIHDIEYGILRHIDSSTFVEDPLRVYRAVQFAARFGFTVAEETVQLCKKMVEEGMLESLPKERVYEEWKKLLLKSPKPSTGFDLMRKWGITERYFPELHALIGVPQDPKWHPEGDVWVHTMMSIDAMERLIRNESAFSVEHPKGICHFVRARSALREEKQKLKLLFAVLCHDFGKPLTTTIELKNGEVVMWCHGGELPTQQEIKKVRSLGHEKAGLEPTRTLMYRLMQEHDFIESILPLVEYHLKPSQFYKQGAKDGAIRRLATKVNIEELVWVAKADFLGRMTDEARRGKYEAGEWLLERAAYLDVREKAPEPLLLGRDLIALGLKPSPLFKSLLDEVYSLQMDGNLKNKEEARAYIKKKIKAESGIFKAV